MQESMGEIVGSSSKKRSWRCKRKSRSSGRRWQTAKTSGTVARSVSRIKRTVGGQAKGSSSASDRKVAVEGATVHGVGAERDDGVEVAEHGEAKDGIDGNVRAERKGNSDGRAGGIDIRGVIPDNRSEVAMIGGVKIRGITNCTAKFNWFKRVRVIKRDKFGNEVRALRFEPKVEEKETGVKSTTRIHKAA